MNRPVYFLEDRSPDHKVSLKSLVLKQLEKINEPPERITPQSWAVYCRDRRIDDWNKKLLPRTKVVIAARFAPAIDLLVAYEDKKIVISDKPIGLPTQKTLKAYEDNLYDRVRLHFLQQKSFPTGLPYVGLHHRLDRDTSGLVLMTKQRQVNKEVSDLFKNRNIKKQYQAYVEWGDGRLPKRWVMKDPIQRINTKKKKFFFAVDPAGRPAHSEFEVIKQESGKYYHLSCFPKTGRTHQLRVHLAHAGHPILGDVVYGKKTTAPRMMLQAHRLLFSLNGQEIEVESKRGFDLG